MKVFWTLFQSQLGEVYVASTTKGVCKVTIPNETREHFFVWLHQHFSSEEIIPHPLPNIEAIEQLEAYFKGERTRFELHLDLKGTEFQIMVWNALLTVPYGNTTSYGHIAEKIQVPNAYQAVGAANGQNPIPIIVPCHRIVAHDGNLTGYAGGIETKRWLLQHEGALLL